MLATPWNTAPVLPIRGFVELTRLDRTRTGRLPDKPARPFNEFNVGTAVVVLTDAIELPLLAELRPTLLNPELKFSELNPALLVPPLLLAEEKPALVVPPLLFSEENPALLVPDVLLLEEKPALLKPDELLAEENPALLKPDELLAEEKPALLVAVVAPPNANPTFAKPNPP